MSADPVSQTTPTVSDAISEIDKVERGLQNLQVTSSAKFEKWDRTKSAWADDGAIELSGYFPAARDGRFRYEVSKHVAKWQNGEAPYSLSSYFLSYNGKVGQELHTLYGDAANPTAILRGTITPDRSASWDLCDLATGRRFSIFGYLDQVGWTFSDFLKGNTKDVEITAGSKPNELVMRIPAGKFIYQFNVDSARGYAITGITETADGKPALDAKIEDLIEAKKGLFYPSNVTQVTYRSGEPFSRISYRAEKVIANEPSPANKDPFILIWPAGTAVEDKINKTRFVAAGPTEEQDAIVAAQVARVRADIASGPPLPNIASNSENVASTEPVAKVGEIQPGNSSSRIVILAVGNCPAGS